MNFHVLTLFPEMIENGMNTSITGRAITTFVIMHSISTRKWMIIPMAAVPEC